MPAEDEAEVASRADTQNETSFRFLEPTTSTKGKLLASEGRSRYVSSTLWRSLGDDEIQNLSEEEDDGDVPFDTDPLTGALVGYPMNLLQYHPTYAEAALLWKTHVESVEPLCKILHVPSTGEMLDAVTRRPATASKAEECLLFAIYHFAVFSTSDENCLSMFGQSRDILLQRYRFATRQALINASFLKTTEISIAQALLLFLIPSRFHYDAQTYWILTGVAIRIGQRMGLHRDGESLGLSPFDVQMRRRIFYQLIPLDGIASQFAGTGIAVDQWDTQQPLNLNDAQIWPGMTEPPKEQKQATEMIFCLARACIGKHFAKGTGQGVAPAWPFKDVGTADMSITEIENEVEEGYIRYCDVVNPLHTLTICQARAAITAMRLRVRLPKIREKTATDAERKEIFELSQKIVDTDITACAHAGLKIFNWHIRSFFAWGSWDSLIFILTTLQSDDLLTPVERDAAWDRVTKIYNYRTELIESKRALHVAVCSLALKAWEANPPGISLPEPPFVIALRSKLWQRSRSKSERQPGNAADFDAQTSFIHPADPPLSGDASRMFGNPTGDLGLEYGNGVNVENMDWMFWDQLIRDYQSQGVQQ